MIEGAFRQLPAELEQFVGYLPLPYLVSRPITDLVSFWNHVV